MIRTILPGYYCGDNDFGEMFLNYWLHKELMPYVGVDITRTFSEEVEKRGLSELLVVWTRCAMGLTPSPYQAVQAALRAKRICLGDPSKEENLFRDLVPHIYIPGVSLHFNVQSASSLW